MAAAASRGGFTAALRLRDDVTVAGVGSWGGVAVAGVGSGGGVDGGGGHVGGLEGGDGVTDDRLDHGLHHLGGLHNGRHLVRHGHGHGPLHRHRPGHRHRHVHLLVGDLGHGAGDVRLDAGDGTAGGADGGLLHQRRQTGRQAVVGQGGRHGGVQVAVGDGVRQSGGVAEGRSAGVGQRRGTVEAGGGASHRHQGAENNLP